MKCPICNYEMRIHGKLSKTDITLPEALPSEIENIPYYQCERCKEREQSPFAFQRLLLNGKWYYFSQARWNFLKEEIFNPSRRE